MNDTEGIVESSNVAGKCGQASTATPPGECSLRAPQDAGRRAPPLPRAVSRDARLYFALLWRTWGRYGRPCSETQENLAEELGVQARVIRRWEAHIAGAGGWTRQMVRVGRSTRRVLVFSPGLQCLPETTELVVHPDNLCPSESVSPGQIESGSICSPGPVHPDTSALFEHVHPDPIVSGKISTERSVPEEDPPYPPGGGGRASPRQEAPPAKKPRTQTAEKRLEALLASRVEWAHLRTPEHVQALHAEIARRREKRAPTTDGVLEGAIEMLDRYGLERFQAAVAVSRRHGWTRLVFDRLGSRNGKSNPIPRREDGTRLNEAPEGYKPARTLRFTER